MPDAQELCDHLKANEDWRHDLALPIGDYRIMLYCRHCSNEIRLLGMEEFIKILVNTIGRDRLVKILGHEWMKSRQRC